VCALRRQHSVVGQPFSSLHKLSLARVEPRLGGTARVRRAHSDRARRASTALGLDSTCFLSLLYTHTSRAVRPVAAFARIQRAPSERARCASTEATGLTAHPLTPTPPDHTPYPANID